MARLPSRASAARRGALAAVLLLTTACASSLKTGETVAERDASGGTPGATSTGSPGSAAVGGPSTQSATPGSAGSGAGGTSGARPAGPRSPATAAGGRAPSTRPGAATPAKPIEFSQGVTPTTIKIGVFKANYAGLGAKGLNMGDQVVQAQAVADYLNARGGIAGRKVILSYGTLEASSNNWESDEQAICTSFTEDQKVWGVIYSLISQGNTLLPCLAKHNTPLLTGVGGVADRKEMLKYADYYYHTGGPDLTPDGSDVRRRAV